VKLGCQKVKLRNLQTAFNVISLPSRSTPATRKGCGLNTKKHWLLLQLPDPPSKNITFKIKRNRLNISCSSKFKTRKPIFFKLLSQQRTEKKKLLLQHVVNKQMVITWKQKLAD